MSTLRLPKHLSVGVLTLLVWALAAGSAAWWLLRLGGDTETAHVPSVAEPNASLLAVDEHALARALGATEVSAVNTDDQGMTNRLVLRGVLTHGAGGAALIEVDNQSAKTVSVDEQIEGLGGTWVLRAVSPHAVVLTSGAREVRLEMPPLNQRASATASVAVPSQRTPPTLMPALRSPASAPFIGNMFRHGGNLLGQR